MYFDVHTIRPSHTHNNYHGDLLYVFLFGAFYYHSPLYTLPIQQIRQFFSTKANCNFVFTTYFILCQLFIFILTASTIYSILFLFLTCGLFSGPSLPISTFAILSFCSFLALKYKKNHEYYNPSQLSYKYVLLEVPLPVH